MKAEKAKTTQDALDLSEQEWTRFVDINSGIEEGKEEDGNGNDIHDILAMKSGHDTERSNRIVILEYLGWYS